MFPIDNSSFNAIKDEAINSVICPIVIRLGVQTIPAASLLIGEASLSHILHYGIILPSPIGVELMAFPAKMIYILEDKRVDHFVIRAKVLTRHVIQRVRKNREKERE